jgi:hypothetical protein
MLKKNATHFFPDSFIAYPIVIFRGWNANMVFGLFWLML